MCAARIDTLRGAAQFIFGRWHGCFGRALYWNDSAERLSTVT